MPYATAVALTVKPVIQAGRDISALQTPDLANGNKFAATPGRTVLRVKNTNASPRTLTIETPITVRGLAVADATFNIPATTGDVLIPILDEYLQPGKGEVFCSLDSITNVTVDVYQI